MRHLDVVLVGASGFTGRLVAQYLARRGGKSVKFALAGRSIERLTAVRDEVAAHAPASAAWDPPLITCDLQDVDALTTLASRTRVVISCAGPFSLCGTPLVGACAAAGTDYVDINGETPWVRLLIDRFDAQAAANGARIIPNCGYTVPSDLSAHHAARLLHMRHGRTATRVRSLVQFNGRLSGGTMATGLLLDQADDALQAERRDPYLLGGTPSDGLRAEDADPTIAEYDASLGVWTAPFWMADITSRVVRRSSQLFQEAAAAGDGPSYFAGTYRYNERALAKDEGVARNLAMPTPTPERRQRLIERGKLPAPGEGPSAAVRASSWFRNFAVAEADGGDGDGSTVAVLTSVRGGDPGYEETSKMVAIMTPAKKSITWPG